MVYSLTNNDCKAVRSPALFISCITDSRVNWIQVPPNTILNFNRRMQGISRTITISGSQSSSGMIPSTSRLDGISLRVNAGVPYVSIRDLHITNAPGWGLANAGFKTFVYGLTIRSSYYGGIRDESVASWAQYLYNYIVDNGRNKGMPADGLNCQRGFYDGSITLVQPPYPTATDKRYDVCYNGDGAQIGGKYTTFSHNYLLRNGDAGNIYEHALYIANQAYRFTITYNKMEQNGNDGAKIQGSGAFEDNWIGKSPVGLILTAPKPNSNEYIRIVKNVILADRVAVQELSDCEGRCSMINMNDNCYEGLGRAKFTSNVRNWNLIPLANWKWIYPGGDSYGRYLLDSRSKEICNYGQFDKFNPFDLSNILYVQV